MSEHQDKRISILIGCYGNYPEYSLRAVNSAIGDRQKEHRQRPYDIHVGANKCCKKTVRQLRRWYDEGLIDSLIESNKNINKCPMKRILIERAETPYALWLDDDSHLLPGWYPLMCEFLDENPQVDVAGAVYTLPRSYTYTRFLQQRPWYLGAQWSDQETEHKSKFATGGCYLFRLAFVRRHNYPDRAMVKKGDDALLGDLVEQQKGVLLNFTPELMDKVRINDGRRRGSGESPCDFKPVDPVTGEFDKEREYNLQFAPIEGDDKELRFEAEDFAILVTEAYRLQEEGRFQEALRFYNEAVEQCGDNAQLHFNIAQTLVSLGKNEEALQSYERAIWIKGDYLDAYNNKGDLLFAMHRIDEAIEIFKKVIYLDSKHFAAFNNLGHCFLKQNRLEEAAEAFRSALRIKPDQFETQLNYSSLLYRLGHFEQALLHGRLAAWHNKESAAAHFHLAFLWFKCGVREEAWRHLAWRFKLSNWGTRRDCQILPAQQALALDHLTVYQECSDAESLLFIPALAALAASGIKITLLASENLGRLAELIPGVEVLNESSRLSQGSHAVPLFTAAECAEMITAVSRFPRQSCRISPEHRLALPVKKPTDIKVAICWLDSPELSPLSPSLLNANSLRPLFETSGTFFYIVCPDKFDAEDCKILSSYPNVQLIEGLNGDLHHIACTLDGADLVIAVDNIYARIAGTLGKQCWVLLAEPSSWSWPLKGEHSEWFKSLKIFRYDVDSLLLRIQERASELSALCARRFEEQGSTSTFLSLK